MTIEFVLVSETNKTETTNLQVVARTNDVDVQNESVIVVNDPNLSALSEKTDQSTPSSNVSSVALDFQLNQDLQGLVTLKLSRSKKELSATNEQLKARITSYEQLLNEHEIALSVSQPTKLDLDVVNDHLPDNSLFQLLTHDLLVQPWLMATNTQSNSGDAEGDDMKFYTLMTF
jgi:hypothetical protein